jgi:hypothetical protein
VQEKVAPVGARVPGVGGNVVMVFRTRWKQAWCAELLVYSEVDVRQRQWSPTRGPHEGVCLQKGSLEQGRTCDEGVCLSEPTPRAAVMSLDLSVFSKRAERVNQETKIHQLRVHWGRPQ